jgi:hypothetical protein
VTIANLPADHAALNDELNAYLDGELDAARRLEVEQHLAVCPVCPGELTQLRVARTALQAQPLLRAPRSFAILDIEPGPLPTAQSASGGGGWQRFLTWGWRLSSVGAAACVLIATLQLAAQPGARVFSTSAQAPGASGPVGGAADSTGSLASKAVPAESVAQAPAGQRAQTPAPTPPAIQPAAPAAQRQAPAAADQAAAPAQGLGPAATRGGSGQAAAASAREAPPVAPPAPNASSGPVAAVAARTGVGVPPAVLWGAAALVLAIGAGALFFFDRRARAG